MRIAYVILAHQRPQQLTRLVDALSAQGNTFVVHVDKKAPRRVHREIAEGLAGRDDTLLLDSQRCYWSGFGVVGATLRGIAAILDRWPDVDYSILLTGQDYPIKSNALIHKHLARQPDAIFLEHFPLPTDRWPHGGLDRYEVWHWPFSMPLIGHVRIPHRYLPLPVRRNFPSGLRPFGGSAYWCLPRFCIEYVHRFARDNPTVVSFFRRVYVPDEMFFHTVVLNSHFRESVVNDDLRYIDWSEERPHPKTLTLDDVDRLITSDDLFARKFDIEADARVLDEIDLRIRP